MVRSECVFCAALLAALFSPAAAEEVAPVGAYGDPAGLAIEGAHSYDTAEISRALATDLDVAYASCADQPLAELKALLVEKVRQAYLRDGFADVRVAMRQEPSRLVLTISEGCQFKAGEVRIIGARSIDSQMLLGGLTKKRERDSLENRLTSMEDRRPTQQYAPRWAVGEPAMLDEPIGKSLRDRVESLLRDQGCFGARFKLSRELDRRRGEVLLHVAFANEGVRQTAANLKIVGAERNSRQAIVNYLGLLDDATLTAEVRSQIVDTLNDSGRFSKVQWYDSVDAAPNEPRLELDEYDQATPIDQPLSREEAALLSLYRWTQRFNKGADAEEMTIDVEFQGVRGGFVSAPGDGFVGWVGGFPGARPAIGGAAPIDLAFVSTDQEIGVYSHRRGRKLACGITPVPAMLLAKVALANLNGRGEFGIGVGATNSDSQKKRHLEFRFSQSAVGAICLAHQKDATFRWHDDVLTIERENWRYVIDARTGRLLEHKSLEADQDVVGVRMYVSRDAFQRKLREIKAPAGAFENFASPRFPASCMAAYACDEWSYWSDAAKIRWMADLAPVVRKLVDKGLLVALDRALLEPKQPDPKFTLAYRSFNINSNDDLPGSIAMLTRHRGLEFADHLSPRGSWPWRMAHEAMFVANGKRDRLARVLDDLKSDASGPIRRLAASALLDLAGFKTEARDVARAGLKNASLTQFRNDYRDLLAPGFYLSGHLLRLAEILRELEEPEVDALARGVVELGLLDDRGSRMFVEAVRRLREQSGERVDRLLPSILDDLWAAGLRDCIELALESAATIPPPPVSFENFAQEQSKRLDEMKRMLRELNLPPEQLKRQLKEIETLEREWKELDDHKRESKKPNSLPGDGRRQR